jgi:hypothetical protein
MATRALVFAAALAFMDGPSFAGIPPWTQLPQDMAVAGPGARSWALALADPFVAGINGSGFKLGESALDLRTRTGLVATLRGTWGVRGRDDLLRVLEALRQRGLHADYDELLAHLQDHPDNRDWLQRKTAEWRHPEFERRLKVVRTHASQLGPAGILAYDISRYVNLARWGYQVGYLSGSETWQIVMAAARLAQSRYDSWDAYGQAFLVGRDFWGGATAASTSAFEHAVHDLLSRPDGPWRVQPWRQNLDATAVSAADPIVGDLGGAQIDDSSPEAIGDETGAAHWVAQTSGGIAARAAALLIGGRTDELDDMVRKAASGDGRDAAGVWRRSQIYAGVATVFPDQLDHPLWAALDRTIADWEGKRPASHAAAIVRAQYWISHAWVTRGHGYPKPPADRQSQDFLADLQRASQMLDDHERLRPAAAAEEPHWAVLRVRLANLSGVDKPAIRRMGMAALRAHPDYHPIAAETALALNPVWGGSQADAQSFLDEALGLARARSGEQLRARVALHLSRNAGVMPALLLARAGFTWEAVKPAVDEIAARYPDPYNLNVARMLGCISDVPARAQPYLQRLPGRVQPIAWFDDPWSVGQCAKSAGVSLADHAPWIEAAPLAEAPERPQEARALPPMVGALVAALLMLWMFVRRGRSPGVRPGDGAGGSAG